MSNSESESQEKEDYEKNKNIFKKSLKLFQNCKTQ